MGTSIKLTSLMGEKFPSKPLENNSEKLMTGVYLVTGFNVIDSDKYKKVLYLDTTKGKFRTTSASVVGSFLGTVGQLVRGALDNGASEVEVTIEQKRANTGRWGIAVKAFE